MSPPGPADFRTAGSPPATDTVQVLAVALLGCAALASLAALGFDVRGPAAVVMLPAAAVIALRYPAAIVIGIFLLAGLENSVSAFTALTPRPAADFLLLSLLLGVLAGSFASERRPVWLWPALLALLLYLALTVVEVLTTEPLSLGFRSFRLAGWTMLAVPLIALAPWPKERYQQLAKAILIASVPVLAYCLVRWVIGPAGAEQQAARALAPNLPATEPLRFFGGQLTPQQLAAWSALVYAFAFALAVTWRERWRWLAAGVAGGSGFLVFASQVRTGVIAIAAATAIVLVLVQLTRALPGGSRTAAAMLGFAAVAVLAAGAITLAVSSDTSERQDRFERILSPGSDPAYSTRIDAWSRIWPSIRETPLGHGLATWGALAYTQNYAAETLHIDSSYLKVAYEQGVAVMLLFAAALAFLGAGLALRSVTTRDPASAALGIAACGTLAVLAVLFYAGNYIERFQALPGWIIVGLGASGFAGIERPRRRHEPGVTTAGDPG